jgi:membrane-associated phospholipid phosphatase
LALFFPNNLKPCFAFENALCTFAMFFEKNKSSQPPLKTIYSLLLLLMLPAARAVAMPSDTASVYNEKSLMFSQPQPVKSPSVWDMVTNLPADWAEFGRQTFRTESIPVYLWITSLTAVLVATDNDTWLPAKKWYGQSTFIHNASDRFVFVGDGKFQFGIAVVFAGYGFIAGDNRALRTASQTAEVILACGGVVQLLKHVTGRESPVVATQQNGRWDLFPNQITYAKHVPSYDAFPSGHLATALSTLTVIAENYPDEKWIRPVFAPVLVGLATGLVTTSIHWWSDFPLSVLLGHQFGMIVAHQFKPVAPTYNIASDKTTFKDIINSAELTPVMTPQGAAGLGLTLRW